MSKTGDTKRKILQILEQKNETLTDISNKLDLAPSTVSQHINEMLDSGMIKQADEDRPRKWKYYQINNQNAITAQSITQRRNIQINSKYAMPIAIILIALVGVAAFSAFGTTKSANASSVYLAPGSTVPQASTVFTISDAPTSYNISALLVTITNASIYSSSSGKWYNIKLQEDKFDLIKLRNISEVLSGVNLSNGVYTKLVLYVSNVTAKVNGTNQTVLIPSNKLTILGTFNISNKTTNWINLDFNLEKSLHITESGQIVMMPVIDVRHTNGTLLDLNQSYIIVQKTEGRMKYEKEFGMDLNGSMRGNYTCPQNLSIQFGERGGWYVNSSANAIAPNIKRVGHIMIVERDDDGKLNVNATASNQTHPYGRPGEPRMPTLPLSNGWNKTEINTSTNITSNSLPKWGSGGHFPDINEHIKTKLNVNSSDGPIPVPNATHILR